MSDFFNPATKPAARRAHQCIGCFFPIAVGETYSRQTGVYDGRWFVNKLHQECADALAKEAGGGWYEFALGELDGPERLWAEAEDACESVANLGAEQDGAGRNAAAPIPFKSTT